MRALILRIDNSTVLIQKNKGELNTLEELLFLWEPNQTRINYFEKFNIALEMSLNIF